MEEESGQLKDWISKFGKDRPFTTSSFVSKKSANTMSNNIEVIESLAALSLGDGTHTEGSSFTPIKQLTTTQAKTPTQSKKRYIKIPNKCMQKFNAEDFSTNNYKAIEAVINDILNTRKSKSSAKKSKAKTDIRPKKLDGTGIALDPNGIYSQTENDKKGKDIKPKSAQPRSYRYYYKKGVSEDKNQFQTNFVPKSLNDLNRIYEDAKKNIHNLNGKKTVPRRKAAADKIVNNIIERQQK